MRLEHETDIEVVRSAAMLLDRENARLIKKVTELMRLLLTAQGKDQAQLVMEIAKLEEQLGRVRQKLFGASSERSDHEPKAKEKQPQRGHGPTDQPNLPIVDVPHDLDEADKTCTACGLPLKEWPDQPETSEEVDVIERRFVVKKHIRKKYRCSCGGCVETAIGPDKLFPGARYSIDFAIEVAAAKYIDHAPLERQVRTMAREGLKVTSQTLWDCLEHLARPLAKAYRAIHAEQMKEPVLGADETRWKLFGKEGNGKTWQVWALSSPHAAYYRIADNRALAGAEALLAGYRGIVMCDGYRGYSALAAKRPELRLAHCWAHVRRRYWEIRFSFPEETEHILALIGDLYAVERECPAGCEAHDLRAELRQSKSRAIVDEIEAWVWATYGSLDPEGALAKAMQYMGGVWPGLIVFLNNPRVGLDNNPCERAIRNPVLGRKNFYGSRSVRGTEVAALFYTLVETAKLAGLEPKAYLRAATRAGLRGEPAPTPREMAEAIAKDAAIVGAAPAES